MSTNRRIHARNVRFYLLILNVAFMLILSDREHPPAHDRGNGATVNAHLTEAATTSAQKTLATRGDNPSAAHPPPNGAPADTPAARRRPTHGTTPPKAAARPPAPLAPAPAARNPDHRTRDRRQGKPGNPHGALRALSPPRAAPAAPPTPTAHTLTTKVPSGHSTPRQRRPRQGPCAKKAGIATKFDVMRSIRRIFPVYGCKLTRDSLDAVWRTVTKDASGAALSHAATTQGIAQIQEPTLDKLLAELGAPERLAEIEFHMYDPGADRSAGMDQARAAHVWVNAKRTLVRVNGPDDTWVLGRAEELRRLLRDTRTRFALSPLSSATVAMWFFIVALVPDYLLAYLTKVHKAALISLLVAAFGLSLALWRWLSRRNATRIILTSDKRQPWSRADRIAGGILIVTVLSLTVIAYQTWGPKH